MTRYWGIRTSKENHDLITGWFEKGVLRQGWGSQDLREIQKEVRAGSEDPELKSIWKYTQRMLDIGRGDLVLTPHQPIWHKNGVWRVIEPYRFDRLEEGEGAGDFGHTLGVEPIAVIDHRNHKVSSDVRRALTTGFRSRMRQLDVVGSEIEELIEDGDVSEPSDAAMHFEMVRAGARDGLFDALKRQYQGKDFERPVEATLETIYPDSVFDTSGPSEKGRDLVVEDTDRLGLTRSLIIQIKMWEGAVNVRDLEHGLSQLKQGVKAQVGGTPVDQAILITLADTLPEDAELMIASFQEESGVPMVVMLKDETLDLMLDKISDMSL